MSEDPGKNGLRSMSSANTHPTAHTSTPGPYALLPNKSSGARYHLRENLVREFAVRRAEDAREAEVRELQRAVGRDEQVVGLQVAVQHPALVAVRHGAQGHLHVALDLGGAQRQKLVLDHRLQVALAALEHEVQVALVRKAVHELDDVGVPELL